MAINIDNYAELDRTDAGANYLRLMENTDHGDDAYRIIVDANNQPVMTNVRGGWEEYSAAAQQAVREWIEEDMRDRTQHELNDMLDGIQRVAPRLPSDAKVARLFLHPLHTDSSIVVLNDGTVWADMEFGLWRNYPLAEVAMIAVADFHA